METLAGKPLEAVLREGILARAGMADSDVTFARWREASDRAVPYAGEGAGPFDSGERHDGRVVVRLVEDYQTFLSTGGVVSTAADLARYQSATMDYAGGTLGLSAGGLGLLLFPLILMGLAWLMPDLLEGTSVRRLQSAAIRAFTPKPEPIVDLFHVNPIKITVADAVVELVDELPRLGRVSFRRLTADLADRIEVIVRFLAVLELFKQGYVDVDQPERFGDIEVIWNAPDDFVPEEILVDAYEG